MGSTEGAAPRVGGCPAQLLHWQAGKGRGAGSFPRAAPGPVVPWALPLGIVAARARPWHISFPSPTAAPAPASLVGATGSTLTVQEPRCAADFTGLPGPPGLQLTAPRHCTPQSDAPQPGTPGRCIVQHPTGCAWLGTGGSAGQGGVRAAGRAGVRRAPGAAVPAVSTSTRQTQPAQGCLFWLGATRGWHYIKPCGAWQVLAGGSRDADGATRGWAPPESLQAPDSLGHPGGQQHTRPPCD